MSGPKHLWSGDWEKESAPVPEEPADRRPGLPEGVVAQPVTPRPPRARGRFTRRTAMLSLAALVVLAAAAWALTSVLGSSGPQPTTNASKTPTATVPFGLAPQPTVPQNQTVPNVPQIQPTVPQAQPTVPQTQTAPPTTTTPTVAPRPIYWLGMEIETVPPGAAVVQTVAAGSQGQLAGIEPGDQIVEVNNRPLAGANGIVAAIRGLGSGDVVQLQISHGSGLYGTAVTLGAPPSHYP